MQSRIGGALYYAKPVVIVSPYLSSFSSNQVTFVTCVREPAIFKSVQLTTDNYLINQQLHRSNYSKTTQFQFKPSMIPLSSLRDDGHKQAVTHI
jgi:hypothetical protein